MLIQFSNIFKNVTRIKGVILCGFLLTGLGNNAWAEASVQAATPVDDSAAPYYSGEDDSFSPSSANRETENNDTVSDGDSNFSETDASSELSSVAEFPRAPSQSPKSHSKSAAGLNENSQFSLLKKINELTQKVQQLQGQLEVQSHDIQVLREQQKSFYQDLDQRLSQQSQSNAALSKSMAQSAKPAIITAPSEKLEKKEKGRTPSVIAATNPAPAKDQNKSVAAKNSASVRKIIPGSAEDADESDSPSAQEISASSSAANSGAGALHPHQTKTPSSPSSSTAQNELSQYQNAYKLAEQKSSAAIAAFQKFLNDFPKSPYAANAHYWLGEMFLNKKTGKTQTLALKEFKMIVEKYPNSPKIPSAMLKMGIIYADQGRVNLARRQFTQVKDQYPSSMAAQLADNRLQQLSMAH